MLTGVVVVMVLIGSSPFDVDDQGGPQEQGALLWSVNLVLGTLIAVVSFAKGKFRMGVLGVVIPLVGAVGATRLARPRSPWAHRFYTRRPHKLARATRRAPVTTPAGAACAPASRTPSPAPPASPSSRAGTGTALLRRRSDPRRENAIDALFGGAESGAVSGTSLGSRNSPDSPRT